MIKLGCVSVIMCFFFMSQTIRDAVYLTRLLDSPGPYSVQAVVGCRLIGKANVEVSFGYFIWRVSPGTI